MPTTDEALAEFRAARNALYSASSNRDRLALARVRVTSDIANANADIDASRTRVNIARAAVLAAIQAEGQAGPLMVAATEAGNGASVNTGP